MVDAARVELASLNLNKYASTSLVNFFYSYDINIHEVPMGLSQEEWISILNKISFAFESKKKNTKLISRVRSAERGVKIKRGFELLEVYIKHL